MFIVLNCSESVSVGECGAFDVASTNPIGRSGKDETEGYCFTFRDTHLSLFVSKYLFNISVTISLTNLMNGHGVVLASMRPVYK